MIDPFVSAKLAGEDVYAKWILQKAAKKEIDGLVDRTDKNELGLKKRQIQVDEFNYLKKAPGQSSAADLKAGSPARRFMISSTYMNLEENHKQPLKAIEFREVQNHHHHKSATNVKGSPSKSQPRQAFNFSRHPETSTIQ